MPNTPLPGYQVSDPINAEFEKNTLLRRY